MYTLIKHSLQFSKTIIAVWNLLIKYIQIFNVTLKSLKLLDMLDFFQNQKNRDSEYGLY